MTLAIIKIRIWEVAQLLVRIVQAYDPGLGWSGRIKKRIIGDEKVKDMKSQRTGWIFCEITKNITSIRKGKKESESGSKVFIEWKEVTGLNNNKEGSRWLLGTALPGFRSCNPPWLRLSQNWDHKPRRRQSLSPWQGCHLCPLHPAWPWAWPVSQWWVRILKGGTT